MNTQHPFYRVSALITAADLQGPLGREVDIDAKVIDVWQEKMEDESGEAFDAICLVMKDGEVSGWWAYDSDPVDDSVVVGASTTIRHYTAPIPFSMIISGNTPFKDLVYEIARRGNHFLFVIDGVRLTGVVSRMDLLSRTGQICLLSLMFLLESAAEELCLRRAKECWLALPRKRQENSKTHATRRFGTPTMSTESEDGRTNYASLVRATSIADKCTMIRLTGLLSSYSTPEMQAVFGLAAR